MGKGLGAVFCFPVEQSCFSALELVRDWGPWLGHRLKCVMTEGLRTTLIVSLNVFWPCWATWEVPRKILKPCLTGHSDSSRQGWPQAQDAVGSIENMPSVVHRGDGQ